MTPATRKLLSLLSTPPFLPPPPHLRRPPNFFPPQALRFRLSISASSAASATADGAAENSPSRSPLHHHPWPEWITFVDRLKVGGYLKEDEGGGSVYGDVGVLKDACLSFGRDRFDILSSLSRQDLQTLVEKGCPNINRKAVNSGKRLRGYIQLDEGDVCGSCILRGSCDRAYVILKEHEAGARTVDVVRLLLSYAIDPLVISGEMLSGRERVEKSARKLLIELTELSMTTPDPALPKPAASSAKDIKRKKEPILDFMEYESAPDVEMKKGDWMCPKCNFLNFSRNLKCKKCDEDGPRKAGDDALMKKGDWVCSECNFMNFSKNIRCMKCKAEGPKAVEVQMKKGDWNCPQCRFMNFASNTKCLRCREQRPKGTLVPGDWECPKCAFPNYKRNVVCRKCNCDKPKYVDQKYEQQLWKKPF